MEQIKSYKLIRSKKRRTIALTVSADATLVVRAPLKTPVSYIEKVISKNKQWLKNALIRISARPKNYPKEYVSGESFLFLGRLYKLKITKSNTKGLHLRDSFILGEGDRNKAKDLFIKWYKKEAKKKIGERVESRAKRLGISYKGINITSANKRWGSCSTTGNLNFSWRLVMAPLSVIDYVIVHEFAHIEHKNHSRIFWTSVKAMYPNYEKAKNWLRENEGILNL